MNYEAQGVIIEIFDEQQVSEKFRKREFVIEIPDGKFPQSIKFQLTQDKCDLLDNYATGQEVKVMFNLSGKPFTKEGKTMYFTNLQAWKLESVGGNNSPVTRTPQPAEADNDLPF
jgi:single-strand DNA-binding protein